ncbi:transposase [Hydrogenispora ethanolica]|jgi:transposase|uniref:Transposase n=1 Tax=Hydrogenispora ethanolica TaxID=1082276 RepID=A0A4R1QMN3_HYDET|nr:IS110 family transposase [Hydrogenispora ethanolica]TCL53495.1 transposase [Hydrogenispora ethanolica]
MKYTTYVGIDAHKETLAVAKIHLEATEADFLGIIPNTADAVKSLVKKLGNPQKLCFCYEAGPCGYVLYRQLVRLGAACIVVAPSLIPTKPGERVKTDRRDAKKLARLLRNGDLTPVWVPGPEQEALRDLVRLREDANIDRLRKRNQLGKFLLRNGIHPSQKTRPWTVKYWQWLKALHFEQYAHQIVVSESIQTIERAEALVNRLDKAIEEAASHLTNPKLFQALQGFKGIGLITAATLVAEIGDITRFKTAKQFMAFVGLVPGESSSGGTRRQGRITKTGNAHVRSVIIEAGWHYLKKPVVGKALQKRQANLSEAVITIAWKAQQRLNHKYRKIAAKGKPRQVAVVAVARELLGFVWAMANQVAKENSVA